MQQISSNNVFQLLKFFLNSSPKLYFHFQACSQSKCRDLCFSDNCNKEVNNARDSLRWTPLHEAVYENRVDVAKQLLENSANVDSTTYYGATALHLAAWKNSV